MTKTLTEINATYHDLFYSEDHALLTLLLAIVIGAKMPTPTVWIYLVGPSSGGKGTVLSTLNKVKWIEQVSDLTPNTFLSGMKVAGKETSLLKRLGNNFCVTMKDYTTLISKDETAQAQIMAQMREIYDGNIVKVTGNGQRMEWGSKETPWKSTFIMATTEEIFHLQEKFSGMGTRAINYIFPPQDRKRTMRASLFNKRAAEKFNNRLSALQEDVSVFVEEMIAKAPHEFAPVSEEIEEEIIDVADLASQCRSVVKRDYRGEKNLALSAEFPMRMGEQLLAIAQLMAYINGGELTEDMKACVVKCAFDSIPKQRRMILEVMTKHPLVDVIGTAMAINYPPQLVRAWFEDLQMHGVVERSKAGRREYWKLRDEHRKTLIKHTKVDVVDYNLESDETGEIQKQDMSWEEKEEMLRVNKSFDETL